MNKKSNPFEKKLPIVIDFDGTLIWDELSERLFYKFCLRYPWKIFLIPFWLPKGVAYIKRIIAEQIPVDVTQLNYNQDVLDFIAAHRDHRFILATGADHLIADEVAKHVGVFEEVIASDGIVNRISEEKAKSLDKLLGKKKYIYMGNSAQDLKVWSHSAYAIAVNAPPHVVAKLSELGVPYEVMG